VYKSLDGGDSWVHLPDLGEEVFQGDIHCLAKGRAAYATSPFGIATSVDEGESWDYHFFPKHHEGDRFSYCRAVIVKSDDPDVIFVGNGDGIPGTAGACSAHKTPAGPGRRSRCLWNRTRSSTGSARTPNARK
jgi:hypothetical protein